MRLERYGLDFDIGGRWTSFSVAKFNNHKPEDGVDALVSYMRKLPRAALAGMEQQATWILSKTGQEISGCCIQAAARDYARFGQFILNGAKVESKSILPDGWLADATTARTTIGKPERGYGYQWWTTADGTFAARGIFGQGIFIDPQRKLVIASNANWAGGASDPVAGSARDAFYKAVQKAVDDEKTPTVTGTVGAKPENPGVWKKLSR